MQFGDHTYAYYITFKRFGQDSVLSSLWYRTKPWKTNGNDRLSLRYKFIYFLLFHKHCRLIKISDHSHPWWRMKFIKLRAARLPNSFSTSHIAEDGFKSLQSHLTSLIARTVIGWFDRNWIQVRRKAVIRIWFLTTAVSAINPWSTWAITNQLAELNRSDIMNLVSKPINPKFEHGVVICWRAALMAV